MSLRTPLEDQTLMAATGPKGIQELRSQQVSASAPISRMNGETDPFSLKVPSYDRKMPSIKETLI